MKLKFFGPPTEVNKKGFLPPFVMMAIGKSDRLVFSNHEGHPRIIHEQMGRDILGKSKWDIVKVYKYYDMDLINILNLGEFSDLYDHFLGKAFDVWNYTARMEQHYLEY